MITGIDHVQVAAPPGCEEQARAFYGGLLGLPELEKPAALAARGGCWFACGQQQLHVGVSEPVRAGDQGPPRAPPARRRGARGAARASSTRPAARRGATSTCPGVARAFVDDPFGNRIELVALDVA